MSNGSAADENVDAPLNHTQSGRWLAAVDGDAQRALTRIPIPEPNALERYLPGIRLIRLTGLVVTLIGAIGFGIALARTRRRGEVSANRESHERLNG